MKRLVILQPGYLPWLGFFDQLNKADEFVLLDEVQYTKRDWRSRNRIKGLNGRSHWLTVPVQSKGRYKQRVFEAEIDNTSPWGAAHLRALRVNYHRAAYYDYLFPLLDTVLSKRWHWLCDLDIDLTARIAQLLGITTPLVRSTALPPSTREASERLLEICKERGCDVYLTGDAAHGYLDLRLFEDAGVHVEWHGYRHPVYSQINGPFVSFLSVVDLVFNTGPQSLAILRDDGHRAPGTQLDPG